MESLLDRNWTRLISSIPFPNRRRVAAELNDHVEDYRTELIERGTHPLDAAEQIKQKFAIGPEESEELVDVHRPLAEKLLLQLPTNLQSPILWTLNTGPLIITLAYLFMEEAMFEIMTEGGYAAMYPILGLGILFVLRECHQLIRLLVLRQHRPANLQIDTLSSLVGMAILLLAGLAGCGLGLHKSFQAASMNNQLELALIGAKESLTSLVMAAIIAAVVGCLHLATRRTLVRWQAPIDQSSAPV